MNVDCQTKANYGDCYQEHLIEQYKLYVNSAEKVSDRRQAVINFFVTINTALISLLGIAVQLEVIDKAVVIAVATLGILNCVIFWFLIQSHKKLNSGKFKVIHELEKKLPYALYDREWEILKEGRCVKTYWPFSHVELLIPWAFGLFYIILGFLLCT
ncbi:MAG: hypothetical protein K9M03_03035 [Kiritimatiellales bacterium]|nr:hypothetical protein [Kiritimatiellales bacterium]